MPRAMDLYATREDDAHGVRFTIPDGASWDVVQQLFWIAVENLDGTTPSEYRRGMVNLIAEMVVLPNELITDCMERVDETIVALQAPVPRPDAIRCEAGGRRQHGTGTDHFVLTFGRPGRVEILHTPGDLVAWVYEGTAADQDQEPLGSYQRLGTNNDWEA